MASGKAFCPVQGCGQELSSRSVKRHVGRMHPEKWTTVYRDPLPAKYGRFLKHKTPAPPRPPVTTATTAPPIDTSQPTPTTAPPAVGGGPFSAMQTTPLAPHTAQPYQGGYALGAPVARHMSWQQAQPIIKYRITFAATMIRRLYRFMNQLAGVKAEDGLYLTDEEAKEIDDCLRASPYYVEHPGWVIAALVGPPVAFFLFIWGPVIWYNTQERWATTLQAYKDTRAKQAAIKAKKEGRPAPPSGQAGGLVIEAPLNAAVDAAPS